MVVINAFEVPPDSDDAFLAAWAGSRAAHRTVKDLAAEIRSWAETWNDNPKPFIWHMSADDIRQASPAPAQQSTKWGSSILSGH